MDVYPNSVAVSGSQGSSGSPADMVPCMPSSSTIPDFINVEGSDDANLEWLSMLVEDCLSTTPCYTPPAPTPTTFTASNTPSQPPMGPPLQENLVQLQSKAKAKRTKLTPRAQNQVLYVDTPLVHQTQWLADSELIYPKDNQLVQSSVVLVGGEDDKGMGQEQQQQPRRCTHCHSQKTPQWRAGPLGPKTLCNACGVRFKSGRLLPEYRPAKSPTFVSYKHSNSHKKVMEMRMALLSPNSK